MYKDVVSEAGNVTDHECVQSETECIMYEPDGRNKRCVD